jgi:hypothetical protein
MTALNSGVSLSGGINISGFQLDPLLNFDTIPITSSYGPVSAYLRRMKIVVIYTATELNAAGISGSTTFNGLGLFVITQAGGSGQPFPSYTIGMTNTALAVGNDITSGWTTVRNPANFSYGISVVQHLVINFNTSFTWDGTSNLGIGFAWGQIPALTSGGTVRSNSAGSFRYAATDSSGTYTLTDSAPSTQLQRPIIRLYRT